MKSSTSSLKALVIALPLLISGAFGSNVFATEINPIQDSVETSAWCYNVRTGGFYRC